MTRRRCCCCPGQTTGTFYTVGHRDLTTGSEYVHSQLGSIDGVDLLYSLHDGDVSGLTQQTLAVGCTAGTVSVGVGGGVDTAFTYEQPGGLRISLDGFVPTQKGFVFGQIVWTNETFNAADHTAHIAAGSLNTAITRRVTRGDVGLDSPGETPGYVFGHAIKAPDDTVFLSLVPILNDGPYQWTDTDRMRCWRGGNATGWMVVDAAGYLRDATVSELRDYGLQIDPLATSTTHEIGFWFGVASFSDDWSGAIDDYDYDCTVDLDDIGIHAIWRLDCITAFYDKTSLIASLPAAFGASGSAQNLGPIEMLGMTWSLARTTLPAYQHGTHPNVLSSLHDAGYCYTGQATASNGIDVTLWYLPCDRLVLQFHDDGTIGCDTYIAVRHDDGTWSEWSDRTGGSVIGEYGSGAATAPAIAGASLINFCVPPHDHPCPDTITGLPDLSAVEWHGVDCLSAPPGGGYFNVDSHRMQCLGPDEGWDAPQCVQGLLPNQLPWLTDCYSLDPIAIGYRKRVSDLIGGSSSNGELCTGPSATELCEAPVNTGDPPIDHTGTPYCWGTRLALLGFTPNIDTLYIVGGSSTYYFYLDITE